MLVACTVYRCTIDRILWRAAYDAYVTHARYCYLLRVSRKLDFSLLGTDRWKMLFRIMPPTMYSEMVEISGNLASRQVHLIGGVASIKNFSHKANLV